MIGELVGNFRVVSRIGRGGMGEVFLAEQQNIGTRVAIKLLLAEISEDSDHVQRFFNEARAVSRIHHAGIVKIFDVGTLPNGQAYLIMEHLEGETLAKVIRRGPLPTARVADIGRQIASVLAATHGAGITHRDLKPDNVFLVVDHELASRSRVKVLDFGIAKLTGTLANASPRTVGTMGTPAYMAPEQWGDSSKVDHRADLYSLGCLAFEMTCGRPPFLATNMAEACAKHLSDPPPSARSLVPDTPPELDALLASLLAKAPDQRPPSMDAVVAAFDAIARTAPAHAPTQQAAAVLLPSAPVSAHAQTVSTQSPPPEQQPATAAVASPPAVVAWPAPIASAAPAVASPTRSRWPLVAGLIAAAAVGGTIVYVAVRDPRPPVMVEREGAVGDAAVAIVIDAGITPVAVASDASAAPVAVDASVPLGPHEATPAEAETIRAVFAAHDAELQKCIDKRTTNARGGWIDVPIEIHTDGRVGASAAGFDDGVADCVRRKVLTFEIAPFAAKVIYTHRLKLKAPERTGGDTTPREPISDKQEMDARTDAGLVMRKATRSVSACVASLDAQTVSVFVRIRPSGAVSRVAVGGVPGPVESCIRTAISPLVFPETQRGFDLTYPYRLR